MLAAVDVFKPTLAPNIRNDRKICTRLQIKRQTRNLAMFNLAIDSKLRGSYLMKLKMLDVAPNGIIKDRRKNRG